MLGEEDKRRDRIVNIAAKKTEDEWAYALQSFLEKVTPLWFTWVGWMTALGGISYVAEKTGSVPLTVIEGISRGLLSSYFAYYFASFRVEPYHSWANGEASKKRRFFKQLPFFVLLMLMWFGNRELIEHVVGKVKLVT